MVVLSKGTRIRIGAHNVMRGCVPLVSNLRRSSMYKKNLDEHKTMLCKHDSTRQT